MIYNISNIVNPSLACYPSIIDDYLAIFSSFWRKSEDNHCFWYNYYTVLCIFLGYLYFEVEALTYEDGTTPISIYIYRSNAFNILLQTSSFIFERMLEYIL